MIRILHKCRGPEHWCHSGLLISKQKCFQIRFQFRIQRQNTSYHWLSKANTYSLPFVLSHSPYGSLLCSARNQGIDISLKALQQEPAGQHALLVALLPGDEPSHGCSGKTVLSIRISTNGRCIPACAACHQISHIFHTVTFYTKQNLYRHFSYGHFLYATKFIRAFFIRTLFIW